MNSNPKLKILVADDEPTTRLLLQAALESWNYEVVVTNDGLQALERLKQGDISLALVDWVMPGLEGLDVCRLIRRQPLSKYIYIIMLTSKHRKQDLVTGLNAGADDFMSKPIDESELHSRIRAGERIIALERSLADKIADLTKALAEVRQLKLLLPICSYCKRIRDDQDYWQQLESYMLAQAGVSFSHGICPECYEKYVKPELEEAERNFKNQKDQSPETNQVQ